MEKLQLFNHPDFQICFGISSHLYNITHYYCLLTYLLSCYYIYVFFLVLSKDHMIPHGFSIKRKTYFQDIKPLSLLWMKYPEVFTPDNTIHVCHFIITFSLLLYLITIID